jgi:hypothetical protein
MSTRPSTAQSEAPSEKKTATAFFVHPLPAHPESAPPYYVRLLEEHVAALTPNEADLVFQDFIAFSTGLATSRPDALVAPFQANDSLQGILDLPLSQLASSTTPIVGNSAAANDGWEKRRAALKAWSQIVFQRAVTVVAANLQHADCVQAAGFRRRAQVGGGQSYTSDAEGLYIHIWRASNQARYFIECLRGLQQSLLEHNIKSIRAPTASVFLYRGLIYTVSAAVPVLQEAPPAFGLTGPSDRPVDSGVGIALELGLLRAAVARHFAGEAHVDGALPSAASFGCKRALDGRVYVTSLAWRLDNMAMAMLDLPATYDNNAILRREAAARMTPEMRAAIRREYCAGGRGPRTQAAASARKFIIDVLVPQVAEELMTEAQKVDGNLVQIFKDNTVARVFHDYGVPMRFLYAVYDKAYASVVNSEKRSNHKYKYVKDALETEMVNRTVKQLIRLELRASPGEDANTHVNRVNRLFSSATQKKTNVWTDMVMPVLRKKYDTPEDFQPVLTAGLLKIMAAYASSRLGCTYDKTAAKFTAFTAIHQTTTLFTFPEEIAASQIGASSAASPTVTSQRTAYGSGADFQRDGSMMIPTVLASQPSMRFEDSSVLQPAMSMRVPPVQRTMSTIGALTSNVQLDDFLRARMTEQLKLVWSEMLRDGTGAADPKALFTALTPPFDHHTPPLILVERCITSLPLLASLMRTVVLLRLLSAPEFDAHRRSLFDAVEACYLAERGSTGVSPSHPDDVSVWTPLGALWLKLYLMSDSLRMADADRIETSTTAIVARLGKHVADDAVSLGRAMIIAAKTNGYVPGTVTGTKLFRSATYVDVGLMNEYFNNLTTAAVSLNVNSDTATLSEVYRLANRVSRRQDVTNRRQVLITSYRKTTAALVASQTAASCLGLRDAVADALTHHQERFGPKDVQTSVVFAQAVYVFVASHGTKLTDKQQTEVRKFHYQVSSMGTTTMEALKATLTSEQFNASLGAMLAILNDLGDTIVAEKALNQAASAIGDLDQKGARMTAAIFTLQSGAAGRLQRMVRLAAKIGPEHLFRRINFESMACRQGVGVLEQDARHDMAHQELFERWLAPRVRLVRFEAREWQRTLWFGARHIYAVPPELPEAMASVINQDYDDQRTALVTEEAEERMVYQRWLFKTEEFIKRQISRREDFLHSEVKARGLFGSNHSHATDRILHEGFESLKRAHLCIRIDFERNEAVTRLELERTQAEVLAELVDRLSLEAEAIWAFVFARRSIEAREGEERLQHQRRDQLLRDLLSCEAAEERARGHSVARGEHDSFTAAHQRWALDRDWILHGEHEILGRAGIANDELATWAELMDTFERGCGIMDQAIQYRRKLAEEEESHRGSQLVGPQARERAVIRIEFDQATHRFIITAMHDTERSAMVNSCTEIGARLIVARDETAIRRAVAREEQAAFAAFVDESDKGASAKRTHAAERARIEAMEQSTRDAVEEQLMAEAWMVGRTEHAKLREVVDALAAAIDAIVDDERKARFELTRWLQRGAAESLEEIEREWVAANWLAELRTIFGAANDPDALSRVRAEAVEREATERRDKERLRGMRDYQESEQRAAIDAEGAARRELLADWLRSTKEGVTKWMLFIASAERFNDDEAGGRDGVSEAEGAKRSRITAAYRSELRSVQQREDALRRAAEKTKIGPVRSLHHQLKADRVRELRDEEATLGVLTRLVKQTESVRQKILHDRVAAVQSQIVEIKATRHEELLEAAKEKREAIEAQLAATKSVDTAHVERAAETNKQLTAAHREVMVQRKRQHLEAVALSRQLVDQQLAEAKQSASERREAMQQARRQQEEREARLIADRPHFSVAQSRADALKEKAETLERVKKEKQILAAIRYLDQKDAEEAAEERRRRMRARLLVTDASRDAVAEKKACDVQEEAEVLRQERQRREGDDAAEVEERLAVNRVRRVMHNVSLVRMKEARVTDIESRMTELQLSHRDAEMDAARQAEADARAAQKKRDEAMVLEQQRMDCRVAEMRHMRSEEGHLLKSPVKSPLPIRHLPPIKHDHTRMLHQQAELLTTHLRMAQTLSSSSLPASPERGMRVLSPKAATTPSRVMNDE